MMHYCYQRSVQFHSKAEAKGLCQTLRRFRDIASHISGPSLRCDGPLVHEVIVNLVFVPAEGLNSDASGMTDRSPAGLLSVMRALQARA